MGGVASPFPRPQAVSGTVVLEAGTAAVAAPQVTDGSLIFLTAQPGAAPLAPAYVESVTPGTGFVIRSLDVQDEPVIGWVIIG